MPSTLEDPNNVDDLEEAFNAPADRNTGSDSYGSPGEQPTSDNPDLYSLEGGGEGGDDDPDKEGQQPSPEFDWNDNESPSRINSKFKKLSGAKKWGIMVFGGSPLFVAILGVGVAIIMILSGFQIGQVARVLKDFNYVFATRNSRVFARRSLLAGIDPNSAYKINNKSSLSRLGLLNESNPDKSILKFDGKPSLLSRRPQTLSIGTETIDIPQGFGRNSVLKRSERRAFIEKIDRAILNNPEFKRLSSHARDRTARGIFKSLDVKLTRWDKSKRFFQDIKDWKTTVRNFYEDTSEKVGRVKAKITFSTNDSRKASELAEEALKDESIISSASGSPGQTAVTEAVIETLEEAESTLSKIAKVASKISVVEIVGWLCLFRDLKKIILDGTPQRLYALQRLAAQTYTAADQYRSGDTSLAALGLTANSYGNFANNISYQKAVFNKNGTSNKNLANAGYEELPEDFNIWQPFSIGKKLIISLGSIGFAEHAIPGGAGKWLSALGFDDDLSKIDDEICNTLTSPVGIISATVVEVVVQIVLGILSAGTETAGSLAAEEAAKLTLTSAAKKAASSLIGKIAFKKFREQVAEKGASAVIRGTIWSFTKGATKFAALTAGSVEAAALLEKVASAGSGLDLGATGPDFNFFNKATMGANSLANSYSQKNNYGRPSTKDEIAEVRQTQYEETLLANKQQNLLTRLSLANPRSPASLFLASLHPDSSYLSKSVEYALNLPSFFLNPGKQNSAYSLAASIFENPDSKTFAEGEDEDDGYHVWFYSKSEEDKLMDDSSFDPDANADYVESNLDRLEGRYGKCYQDDEVKMFSEDIARSQSASVFDLLDADGGFSYCAKVLQEDDALHYRVYKADENKKQYLEDVANATDSNTDSSSAGQSSSDYNGDKNKDTSSMQCPDGTEDLGTRLIKRSTPFNIRLCKIPSSSRGIDDVNVSIAQNVLNMVKDAASSGIILNGGGFRTSDEQIALRKSHCGSSNYAIYEAPANSCSPPTAKPGTSNHELGLAIDFSSGGGSINSSSKEFTWLSANAAKYGLKNLKSEPWHWSVDGN